MSKFKFPAKLGFEWWRARFPLTVLLLSEPVQTGQPQTTKNKRDVNCEVIGIKELENTSTSNNIAITE